MCGRLVLYAGVALVIIQSNHSLARAIAINPVRLLKYVFTSTPMRYPVLRCQRVIMSL